MSLRRCRTAFDDDELARRLGVIPRQTINQVCRRLEPAGRLHQYAGPDGKIVNDLRRDAGRDTEGAAVVAEV